MEGQKTRVRTFDIHLISGSRFPSHSLDGSHSISARRSNSNGIRGCQKSNGPLGRFWYPLLVLLGWIGQKFLRRKCASEGTGTLPLQ